MNYFKLHPLLKKSAIHQKKSTYNFGWILRPSSACSAILSYSSILIPASTPPTLLAEQPILTTLTNNKVIVHNLAYYYTIALLAEQPILTTLTNNKVIVYKLAYYYTIALLAEQPILTTLTNNKVIVYRLAYYYTIA